MRVIVTGAAGLMGRHTVAELERHGHTVIALDRTMPREVAGQSVAVDLREMESVAGVLRHADAVVHLARVPFPYAAQGYERERRVWSKPDVVGDAWRFNDNIAITYNVLAAAHHAGVLRVVLGSSFAVYGLYYPSRPLLPDYLPIDENHPCRPDDAYGLTKLVGERLADGFAAKNSMQIISLRFPGVSAGDEAALRAKRADPMQRGIGGLWTYVDVRDAAAACRLSLEAELPGHHAVNICAPTTFMNIRSPDLYRRYLGQVTDIRRTDDANWAGYDTRKAEALLGFRARHVLNS